MGLFKPAWMSDKSKSTEKALNEVEKINDPAILFHIAKYTPLAQVREQAVQKAMKEREAQMDLARTIIGSSDTAPLPKDMLKMIASSDILYVISKKAKRKDIQDAARTASLEVGRKRSDYLYKTAFPLGSPTKEIIRHIMCICYDMPSINELKPYIQSTVIEKETAEGNEVTPDSRITLDSFSDNAMLRDQSRHLQLIEHHLVLAGYQHDEDVEMLARHFRRKGVIQHQDVQPFLATYYVLYHG